MAKKYYWLKLKDDFFKQKEIKRLRKIAGGDTYTVIYLKMLLLSLQNEGKVFFEEIGDDFVDELALELDEEVDNVQMTLTYLESKGLLEVVNENEYFMNKIPNMIGSESSSAERVRKHREKKKLEEKKQKPKEIDIEADLKELSEQENPVNDTSLEQIFIDLFRERPNGLVMGELTEFRKSGMDKEVVAYGLKKAADGNRNYKYARVILQNWLEQKALTMEAVEKAEAEYQKKNGFKAKQDAPIKQSDDRDEHQRILDEQREKLRMEREIKHGK